MDRQAADTAIAAIREDRTKGAAELAEAGCRVLGSVAREGEPEAVMSVARSLMDARPAMAPIANWAAAFVEAYRDAPVEAVQETGPRIMAEVEAVKARLHDCAVAAIRDLAARPHIFTLSYSSSVASVLQALGGKVRVTIAESRPLMEGRALAEKLLAAGCAVSLITDAQVALAVPDCDTVLLGADAVGCDGCVINKVGSRIAAQFAGDSGISVLAICDSFKVNHLVDITNYFGESENGGEVWPAHPEFARNVTFEAVPAVLVDGYLTDRGRILKDDIGSCARTWRARHESARSWMAEVGGA